jgi:hypothetical protein
MTFELTEEVSLTNLAAKYRVATKEAAEALRRAEDIIFDEGEEFVTELAHIFEESNLDRITAVKALIDNIPSAALAYLCQIISGREDIEPEIKEKIMLHLLR